MKVLILGLLPILSLSSCNSYFAKSTPIPTANSTVSIDSERFIFMRDDKFGYIDRNGKIVIPAQFDSAESFSEGLAVVRIDNSTGSRYGYINTAGKVVISVRFLSATEFKNGLAKVEITEGKIHTIDRTGKLLAVVTAPRSTPLISTEPTFNNGLAWVTIGDRLGYIDKTGKLAIPARYGVPDYSKGEPQSGRLVSKCGSKYCFVEPSHFNRGLAPVMIPERCWWVGPKTCYGYGYINTSGKLVFKF